MFNNPMPKNAAQTLRSVGMRMPMAFMASSRRKAARVTRQTTIVKVGSSATATPLKKNEPPHRTERTSNKLHSLGVIALLILALGDI